MVSADIDDSLEGKIRKKVSTELNENLSFIPIGPYNLRLLEGTGPFDLIVLREVLEHVPDPERILSFLDKLLAPRGLLIVSVPTAFSEKYFFWWDKNWLKKSQHVNIFSKTAVKTLLNKASLDAVAVEGQGFRWFLFWFLLAPFRVNHVLGIPTDHPTKVRIAFRLVKALCSVPYMEPLGNELLPKSHFFYIRKRKPTILVVYDYRNWILGEWAKQIESLFWMDYGIVTMSMFHAYRDREYTKELLDKVDLLHILLPHCHSFFRELSPSKPIISTIHHWVKWDDTYSIPAYQSRLVVTGANEWKAKLIEKGIPPGKIVVIRSGIDDRFLERVKPLLPKSPKMTIGFLAKSDSNEADRKGTRHLKKLLTLIAQQAKGNLFRVAIAGPGWDSYVQEIGKRDIEIVYLNYIDKAKLPAFYQSLDFFLMLSDVEGGPVTIAEAMASRCLVFSTNIGVARDIVIDKFNGILVDNTNCEDIFGKLEYYRKSHNERLRICQNAFHFAKNNMLFKDTFKPLGDEYKNILDSMTKNCSQGMDIEAINRKNRMISRPFKIK